MPRPSNYHNLVAQHAKGVLTLLKDRVICVNIIMRNDGDQPALVGALVSKNPVAIDCAAADLCEKDGLLSQDQIQALRQRIEIAASLDRWPPPPTRWRRSRINRQSP